MTLQNATEKASLLKATRGIKRGIPRISDVLKA